ncbi:MAG: GIY-YIG nuclease family protein [Candidatus Muiribacteriota bacterium]
MSNLTNLYIIILHNKKKVSIPVAKFGLLNFEPGFYFYIGTSYRSPEKRIKRHLSQHKKKHWHLDYITEKIKPVKACLFKNVEFSECELNSHIHNEFCTTFPFKKFGSSDCRCYSHLHFIKKRRDIPALF